MPQYEWNGVGPFRDGRSGDRYDPGETVTLPASVGDPNDQLVEVEPTDSEFVVSADGSDSDSEPEADEEDTYYCGALTGDGTPCEREVDGPDETCWGH